MLKYFKLGLKIPNNCLVGWLLFSGFKILPALVNVLLTKPYFFQFEVNENMGRLTEMTAV